MITAEEMTSPELLLNPEKIAELSESIAIHVPTTAASVVAQSELSARIGLAHALTAKDESLVVSEQLAVLRASTTAADTLGNRLLWANWSLVAATVVLVFATLVLAFK